MMLDDTFQLLDASPPRQRLDAIRLGAFQPRSFVAGPGERAVVWVAGCSRRCPGCMKPELFSFEAGSLVEVDEMAERILAIEGLAGVSFSGGEPFEQAAALGNLGYKLKAKGLTVLVYSGYRIEVLRSDLPRFGPLLEQVDILIDGEYRADLPGPRPWVGSGNQRIHVLTSEGRHCEAFDGPNREIQVSLTESGMRISGFPDLLIQRQLEQELAARGIVVSSLRGVEIYP